MKYQEKMELWHKERHDMWRMYTEMEMSYNEIARYFTEHGHTISPQGVRYRIKKIMKENETQKPEG